MNIIFKWVEYKNILSVGANPIRIQLDDSAKTLITGSNGAGKSTMIEAISFLLYGKSYRKLKKEQLISWVNKKGLLVTGEVSIDGRIVHIERGMKPTVFRVTVDGEPIPEAASVTEYQRIFEEDILGVSHESFKQLIVLGTAGYTPFMELKPEQRRVMVEDLLQLSVLGDMNKTNLKELKQITAAMDLLSVETTGIENEKFAIVKSIEDQKQQNESVIAQQTEQLKTIVGRIQSEKESLEYKKNELSSMVEPTSDLVDEKVVSLRIESEQKSVGLKQELKQIRDEIDKTNTEHDLLVEEAKNEIVDESEFLAEIENLTNQLIDARELERRISVESSRIFDVPQPEDIRINKDKSFAEKVDDINKQIYMITYEIGAKEKALEKFSDGVCPTCGTDIDNEHSHVSDIHSSLSSLKEDLSRLNSELAVRIDEMNSHDKLVSESISNYNDSLAKWTRDKSEFDMAVSKAVHAIQMDTSNHNSDLNQKISSVKTRLESISGETQRKVYNLESIKNSKIMDLNRSENNIQIQIDRIDIELERAIEEAKSEYKKEIESFNKTKYTLEQGIESSTRYVAENTELAKTMKSNILELRSKTFSSDRLDEINEVLIEKSKQREELFNDKYCRGIIKDMLKDDGVKSVIVKKYLPIFNKKINEYLAMTGADYVFTLDESFEESIRSKGREEATYMSFSQGEKARINISLLFTWRYIASKVSGTNISMLVLDEIFDGGMDSEGVFAVNRLLAELGGNTFVISHRVENRDDSFTNHIRMVKKGRFTVMEKD